MLERIPRFQSMPQVFAGATLMAIPHVILYADFDMSESVTF
jgi:hypothetical protein